MLEKKTVVDRIEIDEDGNVGVRLGLLIVDGANELARKWHRTIIRNGASVAAQMAAVNVHLGTMGENVVDAAAVARIAAIAAVAKV